MTTTPKSVTAYITKIRNQNKREYAVRYAAFLQSVGALPEPLSSISGLTYMGAQAVRIRINELCRAASFNEEHIKAELSVK